MESPITLYPFSTKGCDQTQFIVDKRLGATWIGRKSIIGLMETEIAFEDKKNICMETIYRLLTLPFISQFVLSVIVVALQVSLTVTLS